MRYQAMFQFVKYHFLAFCVIAISASAHGGNRIATAYDATIYGPYITPGDLIIDTPTKLRAGRGEVIYYFMPRQWPSLREGGTIWLDGDKLGFLSEIKFANTSALLTPWHISSVRIKNIPHTKVSAVTIVCHGVKNLEVNGESEMYPGLSKWPESRKFLTGAFGFHVINNMFGGHGINLSVSDGGSIVLKGFEVQHGFSGVRINGGKEDMTVASVEISNFYIHDTGDGEGFYLGATHKPPLAKLGNLIIHHGIIARTAAEALQVQHLVGGADIHHITIFAADVRWMNEFMPGQDTGIQWSVDAGENALHHVLLDGFASVGMIPFGSSAKPSGGVSRVSHVLFNDGRDSGMYLHKTTSFGIDWYFDNLYFRSFNDVYYAYTGRPERNYIVSRKYGSDRMTFNDIVHDGTKRKVFQDTTGIRIGRITEKKLPAPEYRNSGFPEPAHCIQQWHPFYGPYFQISRKDSLKVQVATQWDAGDIAIETTGSYRFFKCLKTHPAGTETPAHNPYFMLLTWDGNGIRNDQPGWDPATAQSFFPPDDFRLKEDNYWNRLGIGYQPAPDARVREVSNR